ncbi:MAG: DUF6273 domain-containing protein, partial [Spirochaetaceae bacterium]|nr:DUF6273 domain-containing protein [Spirochaetaceae bacterium]
ADNITINAGSTGAKKGELSGEGPVYTLGISGVKEAGEIAVIVAKSGYSIDPASKTAQIHYPLAKFNGVTADGTAGASPTTKLTLTFDKDIAGLNENDITITAGNTGTVKEGPLHRTATGTYELPVSGVKAAGTVTVGVAKNGCRIDPASKTVQVYYPAAEFQSVTANGATGTATTTTLTLTFDKDIAGLNENDITITAGSTGTTRGTLSKKTAAGTYELAVSGVTAEGEIAVDVSKSGYSISSASKTVQVRKLMGVPVAGAANMPGIKAKFGVTTVTGTAGVAAAFNELHAYIQKGGLAGTGNVIKTGDWIDLEGGLAVDAYGTGSNTGGFSHDAAKAVEAVKNEGKPWGTLCRLIVVGLNSFNNINGNNTPHVVFQFQNIPVLRRMNPSNDSTGGYASSEMRTYLTGNFLTGLKNAGVPEGVLWGPGRALSKGKNGTGAAPVSDKLWLPTEREMFGPEIYFSPNGETADNQARLAYYTDDYSRHKAWYGDSSGYYPDMKKIFANGMDLGGAGMIYWMGSAYFSGSASFCMVNRGGMTSYESASSVIGVAPAFCVN